jgi:hypothetical protein
MKKDSQSWIEYLYESQYNTDIGLMMTSMFDEKLSKYHNKLDELKLAYKNILEIAYGNVKYRGSPVVVIKYKLPDFKGKDKYGKYGFRAQCLLTGQQSNPIKLSEYSQYSIKKEWQQTGGPFSEKWDIENTIHPILSTYYSLSSSIYKALRDAQIKLYKENSALVNIDWNQRYQEYLSSYEWRIIRKNVLEIDNFKCVSCNSKSNLHIHHITYKNVGNEDTGDLLTLCSLCHKIIHQMNYAERKDTENVWVELRQLKKDLY